MANQVVSLILKGTRPDTLQRAMTVTVVDSADANATFADLGGADIFVADDNYTIVDAIGDGTTAPATVLKVQANVGGNDKSKFLNMANIFDPTSTQIGRLGAMLGAGIPQGTNLQLIGRA